MDIAPHAQSSARHAARPACAAKASAGAAASCSRAHLPGAWAVSLVCSSPVRLPPLARSRCGRALPCCTAEGDRLPWRLPRRRQEGTAGGSQSDPSWQEAQRLLRELQQRVPPSWQQKAKHVQQQLRDARPGELARQFGWGASDRGRGSVPVPPGQQGGTVGSLGGSPGGPESALLLPPPGDSRQEPAADAGSSGGGGSSSGGGDGDSRDGGGGGSGGHGGGGCSGGGEGAGDGGQDGGRSGEPRHPWQRPSPLQLAMLCAAGLFCLYVLDALSQLKAASKQQAQHLEALLKAAGVSTALGGADEQEGGGAEVGYRYRPAETVIGIFRKPAPRP